MVFNCPRKKKEEKLTRLGRDSHVEGSEVDEEGESDGLTRARRSDNASPVVRNRKSDGTTTKEEDRRPTCSVRETGGGRK